MELKLNINELDMLLALVEDHIDFMNKMDDPSMNEEIETARGLMTKLQAVVG